MGHKPAIHSNYLTGALTPKQVRKFVRAAVPLLKKYDFQAIAFRGMSGALIAPLLAYKCNKTLVMVRKPKLHFDEHHSPLQIEGDNAMQRYIIVDDLTASGATVRAIVRGVAEFAPQAKCLGCLFFNDFFHHEDALQLTSTYRSLEVPDFPFVINNPADFYQEAK